MALEGSGARGAEEESFAGGFGPEPRTRPGEEKASGWLEDLEQMLPILILCDFGMRWWFVRGRFGWIGLEGEMGGWMSG